MRVFRLIALEVSDPHSSGSAYGVFRTDLGVFSTVANAEEMIRIHAKRVDVHATMLGYALYENELDDIAPHGPWKETPQFLSARTYLADGTLNAFCDCDDACEKQWRGRDKATIRFKPGDFVSVLRGGTVHTELIGAQPITTERGYVGDWSDDCYMTYQTNGGHEHPFTPYVFPLIGTLPDKVREKLLAAREK